MSREAWRLKENFLTTLRHGLEYPLYTDDELALESIDQLTLVGTFSKVAPGLGICGIEIPMELVEKYEETRTWTF